VGAGGWIAILDALEPNPPIFPSQEIEARVLTSVLSALVFCAPQHPALAAWIERGDGWLQQISDTGLRAALGSFLGFYYAYMAEPVKHSRVVQAMRSIARSPRVAPLVRVTALIATAEEAHVRGRVQDCRAAVARGLALAKESGVHACDSILCAQAVYAALDCGDVEEARALLDKMTSLMNPASAWDCGHQQYLDGLEAIARGEPHRALLGARGSLATAEEMGTPFPAALSRVAESHALLALGRAKEATRAERAVRRTARATGSRLLELALFFSEAHRALATGAQQMAISALAKALSLARSVGHLSVAMFPARPEDRARLFAEALAARIEVDYVREIIRRQRLEALAPSEGIAAWPWPLKVLTLGRFAVLRDDEPARLGGRAQQRPLEMLQVLIALGGKEVPEARISDVLWPEADADRAARAFTTTLHRLRALLGNPQAIVRRGWCVSLDARIVWVDVDAFEHLLSEARASRPQNGSRAHWVTERALALYGGPFLGAVGGFAGAAGLRERLRERLGRHLIEMEPLCAANGTQLLEWYERSIAADPLAGGLHRGLIRYLAEQGRRAEALAAYERWHRALSSAPGLEPSPAIEALRRSLDP
jgi:DNA-binding SARP family transcriptional activator